jgi:hypothetical protein
MKVKANFEGLAIVVVMAAVLAKDTIVALTGDKTVNKAGAGDFLVGRVVKPASAINGTGTIETRFKERIVIKASGAIAAGDRVKMAAADGGGIQRVAKWTTQSVTVTTLVDADLTNPYVTGATLAGDSPDLICGVCLVGGADGADIEVLTYR